MNVVIQKAEDIFSVLESIQKIVKLAALTSTSNASTLIMQSRQSRNKRKGQNDSAGEEKWWRQDANLSDRLSRRSDQPWEPLPRYDLSTR